MREKRFKTRSVDGTMTLAERIAEMLPPPKLVILRGEALFISASESNSTR